jgi:uncharacterized protein (DUF433 family)
MLKVKPGRAMIFATGQPEVKCPDAPYYTLPPEIPKHRKDDWIRELTVAPMQAIRGWSIVGLAEPIRGSLITEYRVQLALDQLREFIEINPRKRGGVPVLRGTRFKLAQVFAQIADGDSVKDLVDDLDLNSEQLTGLLHAMAIVLDRPVTNEQDTAG